MEICKQLTISQMCSRIMTYVPELNCEFVYSYLRAYSEYGLSEFDVQAWVQFFDSIVIDRERKF